MKRLTMTAAVLVAAMGAALWAPTSMAKDEHHDQTPAAATTQPAPPAAEPKSDAMPGMGKGMMHDMGKDMMGKDMMPGMAKGTMPDMGKDMMSGAAKGMMQNMESMPAQDPSTCCGAVKSDAGMGMKQTTPQ